MRLNPALCLTALGLTVLQLPAAPYKLKPQGTFIERKLANRDQSYWQQILSEAVFRGIHKIGESVHEEITNRVLGCNDREDLCGAHDWEPKNAYVLAGVWWNDDPPFRFEKDQGKFQGCEPGSTVRLVTFPRCWAKVFKDGEKRAGQGKVLNADNATLLVRSHFGDLQFLHAMANRDGDSASVVRNRIIAWAEFTWRTALGELSQSTLLKDVPVVGISEFFGKSGWSIQDLFALGNPNARKPENMSELVFGSLLHVIEDSFSDGHVERAMPDGRDECPETANGHTMPGRIKEFHSYVNQDSSKHGEGDARNAFSINWSGSRPNVVEVGRTLNDYFVRRASWDELRPYIQCIFTLDTDARPASAGKRYAKKRKFLGSAQGSPTHHSTGPPQKARAGQ